MVPEDPRYAMKIKRFFSNDMRNVIRMVREELGADAVILSNQRVNGGVEIIAAVDYDESLFSKQTASPQTDIQHNDDKFDEAVVELISAIDANPTETLKQRQTAKTRIEAAAQSAALGLEKQTQRKKKGNPYLLEPSLGNGLNDTQSTQEDSGESTFAFTLLDDSDPQETGFFGGSKSLQGKSRINDTLFDTKALGIAGFSKTKETSKNVWSQEPTLVEMRNEIKTLRDLLQQQLTGLAWGDVARRDPVRAKLIRQLLALDINPAVLHHIVNALPEKIELETALPHALASIANQLPISHEDVTQTGGIVALFGPTGVGKTTSIAKIAARYALRYGRDKVALLTTDNFRIGAHEQIRTYGRIMSMPVRLVARKNELIETLQALADKHLILIDTAGMCQRDTRLTEQFEMVANSAPQIKNYLVMSTNTHRSGLEETMQAFNKIPMSGCILTKIDETTNLGGALSVVLQHKMPIAYVCDGQKVPEDLHQARAHNLVSRAVTIANNAKESLEPEAIELALKGTLKNASV